MNLESSALQAASEAVKKHQGSKLATELTLSNGIRVSFKPMPPMLLNAAANSVPRPKVPKVFIEEKGREEENPNHPEYLAALAERDQIITTAIINLTLYACVKIEEIPEGVIRPEDDEWLSFAKIANVQFDENDSVERYLAWMKFYALATVNDLNEVQTIPLKLSGVSEQEVNEAIESFRSDEGGSSSDGISPEQPDIDRDNVRHDSSRDSQ